MKKIVVMFFIFLYLFSFVSAQVGNLEGLEKNVDKLEDIGEKIPSDEQAAKEVTRDYLKQEWTKILEKNKFGRVILFFSGILKAMSPLFKLFIGVGYSLSWFFFLSLGVWIVVFIVIYQAIKQPLQWQTWIIVGISAIIPTMAAQFGTIQDVVEFFIPLLTNGWVVTILIIVTTIILYVYVLFMKNFGMAMEKHMKKETEARREQKAKTVEKIHDIEIKSRGGK